MDKLTQKLENPDIKFEKKKIGYFEALKDSLFKTMNFYSSVFKFVFLTVILWTVSDYYGIFDFTLNQLFSFGFIFIIIISVLMAYAKYKGINLYMIFIQMYLDLIMKFKKYQYEKIKKKEIKIQQKEFNAFLYSMKKKYEHLDKDSLYFVKDENELFHYQKHIEYAIIDISDKLNSTSRMLHSDNMVLIQEIKFLTNLYIKNSKTPDNGK